LKGRLLAQPQTEKAQQH
ncbi:AAA domain family protein, partial [Vibrio parahaemolyticus V-223/04]